MPARPRTSEASHVLAILRDRLQQAQNDYDTAEKLFSQRAQLDDQIQRIVAGMGDCWPYHAPVTSPADYGDENASKVWEDMTGEPDAFIPVVLPADVEIDPEPTVGQKIEYTPAKRGTPEFIAKCREAGKKGGRGNKKDAQTATTIDETDEDEPTVALPSEKPSNGHNGGLVAVPALKPSVLAYAVSAKKPVSILLTGGIKSRLGDDDMEGDVQETYYGDTAEEIRDAADEAQAIAAQAGSMGLKGTVTLAQDRGGEQGVINLWTAKFV